MEGSGVMEVNTENVFVTQGDIVPVQGGDFHRVRNGSLTDDLIFICVLGARDMANEYNINGPNDKDESTAMDGFDQNAIDSMAFNDPFADVFYGGNMETPKGMMREMLGAGDNKRTCIPVSDLLPVTGKSGWTWTLKTCGCIRRVSQTKRC